MREWWLSLAIREKQAVLLAACCLILFIIYKGIWSPLVDRTQFLRNQVEQNQKLLIWMQTAKVKIEKLEKESSGNVSSHSPVNILSYLQRQISVANLNGNLTHLKQGSNDTIEIHFQKVEFDKIITLLTAAVKEKNILINQMSVVANGEPGLVDAEIVVGYK